MRILVTGSRDWGDWEAVWRALDEHSYGQDVTVVHGACPTGADAQASSWCEFQTAWREAACRETVEESHPADWSKGRKAGPERNAHMVSLGADVCLAFIGDCTSPRCNIEGKHSSHGASGCADLAEKAGIPTRRFTA